MYIYLLGILHEYLIIINAYNGDLIPSIPIDLIYSIPDIIILIYLFVHNVKIFSLDFMLILLTLFSHLQWYVHNPFYQWPEWWIYEKSHDDIRHRTEYYDTRVMCFSIYLILFIRFYDKKNFFYA